MPSKNPKKSNPKKKKDVKKEMVNAGLEYLRVRNNKPTRAGYNKANYDRNLDKARKRRDSLRTVYRKTK